MPVAIIINPISGAARPDVARARAQLALSVVDTHGDPAEVFVTERPGHARELAKAAAARGVRLVIAWGGDGTINEVASALAFDETPLAIVPAGSGNGLARELGVNMRPERAIGEALRAEPQPLDVGEIDGRLFVNIAGIGLDAYVASRFNAPGNPRRGLLGYAALTARALLRYEAARYRITISGGLIEVRAVLVTIANSAQFGNGARIAPGARVDDGQLDLVVVEERSRLATLSQLPRLFNGTAARIPGCTIRRIQTATIEADQPMTFHVDGEPVSSGSRLRVRVHPGALRVCVKPHT
ncbi:MAG: diacylglycerol kinase family lipid kinase [Acidobacteria bacterium]|nr:diacylglycerol kinase family lipid kinase [Acidobacteriota bacterium]